MSEEVAQSTWTAGSIFGLCSMIVFLPCQAFFTWHFWQRRGIQPIKARIPGLVLLTDCITFLWIMQLGLQRISKDSYPCLVNLWTGYIGTIFLFNTYVWRCWVLYFKFELTSERLNGTKKKDSTFMKRQYLISDKFAFKFLGTLTCILLLPCGILTAGNEKITQKELAGDDCNRFWGDDVLLAYMFLYVMVFLLFACKLRNVVEGFRIKEELFITAVLAPCIFIPWFIFNTAAEDVNNKVFPFSTLCLVLGVAAQFCVSTIWPLWQSLKPPSIDDIIIGSADVNSLQGVLKQKKGVATFKKFLTKEFSVENVLFYEEIEVYRGQKATREKKDEELVETAQMIYAKYIIPDAPFQVNLPQDIVKNIDLRMKLLRSQSVHEIGPTEAEMNEPGYVAPETPTIFDAAQKNIFKLMNTDSFPRYQRSEEYKQFVEEIEQMIKKTDAMKQADVI